MGFSYFPAPPFEAKRLVFALLFLGSDFVSQLYETSSFSQLVHHLVVIQVIDFAVSSTERLHFPSHGLYIVVYLGHLGLFFCWSDFYFRLRRSRIRRRCHSIQLR